MKDDNKSTSKCKEIVNSIAFHLAEASGAASGTFCPTPLTFQNAAHGVEHLQGEPSAALAQGVLCRWRHAAGMVRPRIHPMAAGMRGVFAAHACLAAPGLAFPLNGLANADPRKGKRKMCRSPVVP